MRRQRPLRELIYKRLIDEILSGRISPGDKLVELELAKKYKVSRTPIREAFLQMEKKGFIVQKTKRSAVVENISTKQVEDIYKIIALLEGYATELVATAGLRKEEISYLKELMKDMEVYAKAKNYSRYLAKNDLFHAFFLEKSLNDTLREIVSDLRKRAFRTLWGGLTLSTHIGQYLESHKRVIDSIADGEPEKAGQAMRQHGLDAIRFMVLKRIR